MILGWFIKLCQTFFKTTCDFVRFILRHCHNFISSALFLLAFSVISVAATFYSIFFMFLQLAQFKFRHLSTEVEGSHILSFFCIFFQKIFILCILYYDGVVWYRKTFLTYYKWGLRRYSKLINISFGRKFSCNWIEN